MLSWARRRLASMRLAMARLTSSKMGSAETSSAKLGPAEVEPWYRGAAGAKHSRGLAPA